MDNNRLGLLLGALYEIAAIGTFVFLTFLDDYRYTAWNWIIVVPINFFFGQIWPLYWLLFRWM